MVLPPNKGKGEERKVNAVDLEYEKEEPKYVPKPLPKVEIGVVCKVKYAPLTKRPPKTQPVVSRSVPPAKLKKELPAFAPPPPPKLTRSEKRKAAKLREKQRRAERLAAAKAKKEAPKKSETSSAKFWRLLAKVSR